MIDLKPCPFCGGEPYIDACDRLITIGRKPCGFRRSFHGLVQSEVNTGIPIVYKGGKVSDCEWYDRFAHEKAVEAWNRRAK